MTKFGRVSTATWLTLACSLGASVAFANERIASEAVAEAQAIGSDIERITFGDVVDTGGVAGTACALSGANCQDPNQINGLNVSGAFRVADDFSPSASGNITEICWWGVYQNAGADCGVTAVDAFTLRIYSDNNGLPGTVLGTYVQGTTLAVTRATTGALLGTTQEWEFRGVLSGTLVNATAGTCYWLEIVNGIAAPCVFFWETGTGVGASADAFQDANAAYTLGDFEFTDMAFCTNLALTDSAAEPCRPNAPANDLCANATVIANVNDPATLIDLRGATDTGTDPVFSCKFGGAGNGVGSVWYRFTATSTRHRISTCGSPGGGDTIIAVYTGTCGALTEIACNDDSDQCGTGSTLSDLCVTGLTIGTQYYVQLAAFDAVAQGVYSFDVGPCLSCQDHLPAGGYIISPSDVAVVRAWDDFQAAETGQISYMEFTGIYWNGVNGAGANVTVPPTSADLFTVEVCEQGPGNLPTTNCQVRSLTGGTLTQVSRTPQGIGFDFNGATPGGFAEFQRFVVTFNPPINVTAGQCYWFSVANELTGQPVLWRWLGGSRSVMTAGNDRRAFDSANNGVEPTDLRTGDYIWCVDTNLNDPTPCADTTPPPNDNCTSPTVVACSATPVELLANLQNATEAGSDPVPSCLGTPAEGTVWYSLTTGPSVTSFLVETCPSTNAGINDTILAVFTAGPGGCNELTEVACANDNCGTGAVFEEILVEPALPNTTYFIMLGAPDPLAQLSYRIRFTCPAPPAPANDLCANAEAVTIGTPVNGTTLNARLDQNAVAAGACNGLTVDAKGVWYTVVGNGNDLRASMCDSLDPFDSVISVYCGTCENLVCVNADDDGCGAPGSGTVSQVDFCSTAGITYYILVHNFLGDLGGAFTLTVSDLGTTCTSTVVCPSTGCPGNRGDTNCDGGIDFFDIDPFLLALFNPAQYASTFCGGSICAADIDCSGQVDFFDIDPFLACLFTACPPCP